jgi:FAD/FMN-containing dehydrogenase
MPILVNDVHSALNPTRVREVVPVASIEAVQEAVRLARDRGVPVCVAGGRHAMGGQNFASGAVLLDTRRLNHVGRLDAERGTVEVQAGVQWPQLVEAIIRRQRGRSGAWGIAQKQTGADRLSIGGAVAANIHGRGLRMRPFVADVESLLIVDARGELRRASRAENSDLFRLAVGGYGLFGVVASVTLRLAPRRKLRRTVSLERVENAISALERRRTEGALYGDFQFAIDEASPAFLRKGVLASYLPVDPATPVPEGQVELSAEDWMDLLRLAHTQRTRAFERYARHYLSTAGQVYWSDTHQLGLYIDGYHQRLDRELGAQLPATEVITEVCVPRAALADFMEEARRDLRRRRAVVVYGTVRIVERDDETFLPWAKEPYACVIINIHTEHSREGVWRSAEAFRSLIDMARRRGGSFYLTYHRFATREQVEACHPRFAEFLRRKHDHDPEERFQSDWYRHYRGLFAPLRRRTEIGRVCEAGPMAAAAAAQR